MRKLYVLTAWCLFVLSCGLSSTQTPETVSHLLPAPSAVAESPSNSANDILHLAKPRGNAIAVNFGRVVQLKAVYLEKREAAETPHPELTDPKVRHHFGLLATSSLPGTGFSGEGELAYSQLGALGASCDCDERPMMLRLAFKNRWEALSYGGEYRSFSPGFVSVAGVTTDLQRDEGEFWSERSWGAFKIRGSMNQLWEQPADATVARVTRGAAATFSYNKPQWSGSFASSYSVMQPETGSDETNIASNRIAASYRPNRFITFTPSLDLRQEWNTGTGVRTETPTAAFGIVYAPFKDRIRLSGDTSLTRTYSTDGSNDARTFGTGGTFDWKIGKFIGSADTLSFSLNYNHRLNFVAENAPQNDVRGMLLFKVVGF